MTSLQARAVTPERLDDLPPSDPEAMASRRDLRRINALMFNAPILARLMRAHVDEPPRRMLELGCGDGHLTLALARRMAPAWPGVHLTLLDAQPVVPHSVLDGILQLGWTVDVEASDAMEGLGRISAQDLVCCNLFLHHFDSVALTELLGAIATVSRACIATEPRRGAVAQRAAQSLAVIGANAVTRHDAVVSVRAGFRAGELSAIWSGRVRADRGFGPFTHGFAAVSDG